MDNQKSYYTVSEITSLIKGTLEEQVGYVQIQGEISNFRPSSAGHYYFTLKDDRAVISAVMFRGRNVHLTFQPADGKLVLAEGKISVYEKRGTYQIICESLQPAGEGNILAMLEERKKRFAEEGLFDRERKKQLPMFPSRVAVVTSSTGAAIKDILRVLRRRNSGLNLVILPTLVQGDEAAAQIAAQIKRANMFDLGEVIIVSRGGGSLEDLLPFSDEQVVRAVAASDIPVISAVGHEIDVSLCDLAADIKAPTPSAAAEMVSTSREELYKRVIELKTQLITTIRQKTERVSLLLRQFTPEYLEKNFQMLMQPFLMRLDDAKEELVTTITTRITEAKHKVSLLESRLEAGSPLHILKKGYAVVTDPSTRQIIKAAKHTAKGKAINVRFAEDALNATVEEIKEEIQNEEF